MEEQKPFACTATGCGKSFTNEDHWSVHSKKHEMSLNLGLANKSSSFIDQTPTPTRLFKQWEEVGLFDELHENPFEETFRRAVESKSTPISTNLLQAHPTNINEIATNDDTLHTPQIFSHYNNTTTSGNTKEPINFLQPKEDNLKIAIKRNYRELLDNSTKNGLKTIQVTELIPKPANIIIVQKINPINVSTNNINKKILPKIKPVQPIQPKQIEQPSIAPISVKEKLKSLILNGGGGGSTDSTINREQNANATIDKKLILVKQPQLVKTVKYASKVKMSNKQQMEERNREAARRYRGKKKIQQKDIVKLNEALILENSILKQKLEAFEMTHRNCSVSNNNLDEKKRIIYLVTNTKLPNS